MAMPSSQFGDLLLTNGAEPVLFPPKIKQLPQAFKFVGHFQFQPTLKVRFPLGSYGFASPLILMWRLIVTSAAANKRTRMGLEVVSVANEVHLGFWSAASFLWENAPASVFPIHRGPCLPEGVR